MPRKKEYPYEEAEEYKAKFSFFHKTIAFKMTVFYEPIGDVEMEGLLYPMKAPITVKNFVSLAKKGFYDNTRFHRMVRDKIIQGGDPTGTGEGGSKKKIYGEFRDNEYKYNDLQNIAGALGMARMEDDMNSATSQFYICINYQYKFNGKYAVFGRITKGAKNLDKINHARINKKDELKEDVILKKIEILDDRDI